MIKSRHVKKGLLLGLPLFIVFWVSSARYSGSVLQGAFSALAAAGIAVLLQAVLSSRAELRNSKFGITLVDPPLRPKMVLESPLEPDRLLSLCRNFLRGTELKIKRIERDSGLEIVALTKISFYSSAERITVAAKACPQGGAILEISSIPRLDTAAIDNGTNYKNVYLIADYIKRHAMVSRESLVDLDKRS